MKIPPNVEDYRILKIPAKVILLTCLLTGTLDISAAMVDAYLRFGTTPVELFQFIASGAFGIEAFKGGLSTAAAGLLFHYFIASSWTVLFFIMFPRLNLNPRNKVLPGILY